MVRAVFRHADFLDAALTLAAERGPAAVTVGAITARLRAPTGSFYHRFVSRNALLGALWLRTVLDFQVGVTAALDANDGLQAALHTPAWARANLDAARLLLLYDREDFVQGDWPEELRERVAEMTSAHGSRRVAERAGDLRARWAGRSATRAVPDRDVAGRGGAAVPDSPRTAAAARRSID